MANLQPDTYQNVFIFQHIELPEEIDDIVSNHLRDRAASVEAKRITTSKVSDARFPHIYTVVEYTHILLLILAIYNV